MRDLNPCPTHGAWCFIQPDGTHIAADRCPCHQVYRADCPVDDHRGHAGEPTAWAYRAEDCEIKIAEPEERPEWRARRDHLRLVRDD